MRPFVSALRLVQPIRRKLWPGLCSQRSIKEDSKLRIAERISAANRLLTRQPYAEFRVEWKKIEQSLLRTELKLRVARFEKQDLYPHAYEKELEAVEAHRKALIAIRTENSEAYDALNHRLRNTHIALLTPEEKYQHNFETKELIKSKGKFVCTVCPQEPCFASGYDFRRHLRSQKHQGHQWNAGDMRTPEQYIDEILEREREMRKHKAQLELRESRERNKAARRYVCTICNPEHCYSSLYDLRKHRITELHIRNLVKEKELRQMAKYSIDDLYPAYSTRDPPVISPSFEEHQAKSIEDKLWHWDFSGRFIPQLTSAMVSQ